MSDTNVLAEVAAIYEGSNGDATKAMYDRLTALGPIGVVATNLFRAQKTSSRAKVYRGRRFKGAAYDTKQWSMGNLARSLTDHAEALGITWGWQEDPEQAFHKIVLYIDLPTGQVSFHTDNRGIGPDYPGNWDGIRGVGASRIISWCTRLLETAP